MEEEVNQRVVSVIPRTGMRESASLVYFACFCYYIFTTENLAERQ